MELSERTWRHIRERHPELTSYRELILEVLARPELILKGKQAERKALRHIPMTPLGPKYLVVVYRKVDAQKIIITAYLTSDLKRVKGETVWKA